MTTESAPETRLEKVERLIEKARLRRERDRRLGKVAVALAPLAAIAVILILDRLILDRLMNDPVIFFAISVVVMCSLGLTICIGLARALFSG